MEREEIGLIDSFFHQMKERFYTNAQRAFEEYKKDEHDFFGSQVNVYDGTENLSDTSNSYGNQNKKSADEDWQSQADLLAKLRSKTKTGQALLKKIYRQRAGEFPIGIEPSLEADVVEWRKKQMPAPSVDEVASLQTEANSRHARISRTIEDCLSDGGYPLINAKLIDNRVMYGSAYCETGIEKTVRRRVYLPTQNGTTEASPQWMKKQLYTCEVIRPYDALPDPDANGDPQEGEAFIIRKRMSQKNFMELVKNQSFSKSRVQTVLDGIKKNSETDGGSDYESSVDSDSSEWEAGWMEQQNSGSSLSIDVWTIHGDISRGLLEKWSEEEDTGLDYQSLFDALEGDDFYEYETPSEFDVFQVTVHLANKLVIYIGPNSTPNHKRPVAGGKFLRIPDSNYSSGMPAILRPYIYEAGTILRRIINNATLVGAVVFLRDSRLDLTGLEIKPGGEVVYDGKKLPAAQVKEMISQLKLQDVSSALWPVYQHFLQLIDEDYFIIRNLQGLPDKSSRTATELEQNLGSAEVNIVDIVTDFDSDTVQVVANDCYQWLMMQPDTPEYMLGDFIIKATGVDTFQMQTLEFNSMLELVNATAAMPDAAKGRVNFDGILTKLAKNKGLRPEDVLLSEETHGAKVQLEQQVQQLTQQNEQMQAQMQQMQNELGKAEENNKAIVINTEKQRLKTDFKAKAVALKQKDRSREDALKLLQNTSKS